MATLEEEHERKAPRAPRSASSPRKANRGALPAHLPRIEQVIDVASTSCPCCAKEMHKIGEDVAERLDVVPAQLRVIVTTRMKAEAMQLCQPAGLAGSRASQGRWHGNPSLLDWLATL